MFFPHHPAQRSRGLTLVEFAIVAVIGAIVIIPFGVFMVQMVQASNRSSEKLVLSSDAHIAAIALRVEMMMGEAVAVYNGGSQVAQGVEGDAILLTVSGSNRSIQRDAGSDSLVLQEGGTTRTIITNVLEFAVTQTADSEVLVDLKLASRSDDGTTVRIRTRLPVLNAIQE